MARVSIEDCLHSIENRFALAMVAADRARSLMTGEVPMLRTKNKEVVTALREITDGLIFSNVAIPEREGELGVMPKNYDAESEDSVRADDEEMGEQLENSHMASKDSADAKTTLTATSSSDEQSGDFDNSEASEED